MGEHRKIRSSRRENGPAFSAAFIVNAEPVDHPEDTYQIVDSSGA